MPPDMAISMRHTKLKAEEAALLAGELNKPSWESRNEGIHERVSFEDTIWGFDLAGGIFYKTPLRVTMVKPDSRAEKAGIRPGDRLLRINDLDTSTLTIQQAHDIIVESGIHLKLSVTSPDDEEDSYYCYEDPLIEDYDSEEERQLEEEKAEKRRVCAKVSHFWSLQWPWVSKRRFIYRESNCFMVPSKYEDARRDKYPPLPSLRYTDDIVHFHKDGKQENEENTKRIPSLWEVKQQARKDKKERLAKAAALKAAAELATDEPVSDNMTDHEETVKGKGQQKSNRSRRSTLKVERQETIDESKEEEGVPRNEEKGIEEMDEEMNETLNGEIDLEQAEEVIGDLNDEQDQETNKKESDDNNEMEETAAKEVNVNSISIPELNTENDQTADESAADNAIDDDNVNLVNGEVNDDEVLDEVLGKTGDSGSRSEEDNNILDSILSDDGQNLESSESNNER